MIFPVVLLVVQSGLIRLSIEMTGVTDYHQMLEIDSVQSKPLSDYI